MDLKEIGYKLALIAIKWFLEDTTRIFAVIVLLLFVFMYVIGYSLAYLADKKLEAEEEQQKNKIDTK